MLIKNGMLVLENGVKESDLLIENGIIKEIGQNLTSSDDLVIDASSMYVIPGGVDVHTHLDLDLTTVKAVDDFYTGTVAASMGGTTTIVDHIACGPVNCSLLHQVKKYHTLARDKAVIDYSFHGVIQHVDEDVLEKMEALVSEGITSYKIYMTYDFKLSDADIYKVLKRCKELGLVLCVHPENDGVISYLKKDFVSKGKVSPKYHPLSRPYYLEAEAVNRMLLFSKIADNPLLYFVHLSNALALSYCSNDRASGFNNILTETCPQYLLFDDSKYDNGNESLKYILSPPLRNIENIDKLWDGIKNHEIDVIATDHCPFNYKIEKQMGKDDFTKCPNGMPSIELRIPIIFSEGVMKNRIDILKFVKITSTNPAKIFGLYPKKGVLKVGSDADITIIDPNKKIVVKKEMLHENVDYTPYEGLELLGYPSYVISRGKLVKEHDKFVGKKGNGKFIKRNKANI